MDNIKRTLQDLFRFMLTGAKFAMQWKIEECPTTKIWKEEIG